MSLDKATRNDQNIWIIPRIFRMSIPSPCWLCSWTFGTKKELRANIGRANHLRLRVVCPWYTEGERTSNRIGDLKRHAVTKHGSDSIVTEKFFTDVNGFYLSTFPEDYSRLLPLPCQLPKRPERLRT